VGPAERRTTVLTLVAVDAAVSQGIVFAALAAVGAAALFALDELNGIPPYLAEHWPLLALVSGLGAGAWLPQLTERTGSPGFYSAAAQVIPVLLLAIALELRLRPKRAGEGDIGLVLIAMAVLGLGEFYALHSVEQGEGTMNGFSTTVGALVTGTVALVLIAMSAAPGDPPSPEPDDDFPHPYL
jgi:hypothetical protein